jgi:hypothetical protein
MALNRTACKTTLQIVVYYEVPEGMRSEIKRIFQTFTRNEIKINR